MELLNERPPSSAELLGSSQLASAIGCSSNSQFSATAAAAAAAAATAAAVTANHLGLSNNKSSNVGAGVSFSSTIAGLTSSPSFSCSSFSSPSSSSFSSCNSTSSFPAGAVCPLPINNSLLSSSALVSSNNSSLVSNHSTSPVISSISTHNNHLESLINSTGGVNNLLQSQHTSQSLSSNLPGVCNNKNQSQHNSASFFTSSSHNNPLSSLSFPFNHNANLSHPSLGSDQLAFHSGQSTLVTPFHHNSSNSNNKSITRSVLGPISSSTPVSTPIDVVPTSGLHSFSVNSQVLPHSVISSTPSSVNNSSAHLHHHSHHHLHHSVTSPLSSSSSAVKVKRTRQRVDAGEPRNSYASITNYSCSRLAKQQREAHFAAQLSASLHQAVQQQNSLQLHQQFQQQFNTPTGNNNLIANRLPTSLNSSHQASNQNIVPSSAVASLSTQQQQQQYQQQLSLLNQLAQLQSNPTVAKQLLEQLNSYGVLGLQALFSALAASSSTSGPETCAVGSDTSFDPNQTSPVLDSAQTSTLNALLASLSTVKPSMILLDDWNSSSSNPQQPPPPLSSTASTSCSVPSMAAMQADLQMLDLNTLNNSEQAVSLDYSNKGRRSSKLDSEMDSAQPVSPATPNNLMLSTKLSTTTANQPRCADSESGSSPNSPTPTVSPTNDENDPNTHNNSKEDPNQDDQTQPMDQLLHKNHEECSTAAIAAALTSTVADAANSISPAVSRCSSPQSVASSSGVSTKSAESKRARVDSIVNSMISMAERAPSAASDRIDTLAIAQSVNGCKKRKLNQPQQCRTDSIEPGMDSGMANSDLEQLTCEPELDSNADDDDDDMDQNSIEDGDENSFSDRHLLNRNGYSMNSKNDLDRVRSHVEHLMQLYMQQQQDVNNRLNGQSNNNNNNNNNNCVAMNLSTSASPPPMQTTELNDDCESTDSRSELPEQVQAALNECFQLLHDTQRLLSSKRIYSDLRHKLRSKLRAAAHWGDSLQAQPIFDELRQQLQSACSQAVEQCFTKQRLAQMQAAIAVRVTIPSVRNKDNHLLNNAIISGSKMPLQSSLANLLDPRNSIDAFADFKSVNQFNQLKNGILGSSSLPIHETLPASLLHQFNILQQQQQRLSSPLTAGGQVRRESASGDSLSGLPLMTPKRRRIKASDEPRRTRTSNRLPPPSSNNTPVAAVASAMKSTSEMLASIISRDLNSPAGAGSGSSVSQPSSAAAAVAAAANQLHMSNPLVPVSLASQNDLLPNIFGNPFSSQLLNGSSVNNAELDLHHLFNVANGASNAILNNPLLANGLGAALGNGSARNSPDSMQNFAQLGLLGRLPDGLGDAGSDVSMSDINFENLPITSTLSPMHLRKAKLMFFYVRYPHSNVLKSHFPDILFNKANTAQLVKWFSNFREFYYIQIEKYTRAAIADGIVNADDIVVPMDSEIIRVLNLHYNRNNHIELPVSFRDVVEKTMREFFKAIKDGRDDEAGWKKIIYKIIQRYEDTLPEYFKKPNFLEVLDGSMRE